MRNGYQKETGQHSEWQKCRFVRVERERRHSTNKYLLSAYCVPGTVHIPPGPSGKKTKTKQDRGSRKKTLKEKNGQLKKAEGTKQPEVMRGSLP